MAAANGFSLHAGVAGEAHQREKIERLCRHHQPTCHRGGSIVTDLAGQYSLCTEDPVPGRHPARSVRALGFHGAPSGIDSQPAGELDPIPRCFHAEPTLKGKGRAWPGKARWGRTRDPSAAARLDGMGEAIEGVFGIEVERCDQCGGGVRIIAAIENPAVINKVPDHLGINRERPVNRLARGPPV